KMLYKKNMSPFIFDTINQITQDEIGWVLSMALNPWLLDVTIDYEIRTKTLRNLNYTLGWMFQCWQFNTSINTVWEEIRFGVSVPIY
ncbi:MAG: hypothetical protein ACO3K7_05760, partial [Candidatus Marinamargulisbacteria bacterium]